MPAYPALVYKAGVPTQTTTGDTLNVPINQTAVRAVTNGTAGAMPICTPVYISGNDTVQLANAAAGATVSAFIGLMYDVSTAAAAVGNVALSGPLVATTAQWDAVAGTTGGLAAGTKYWVSTTVAGKLTSTAPSTAGTIACLAGVAISSTELDLSVQEVYIQL